ncbi:hypothetical protein Lste_2221 [Legionella steelei]|uniref:Uncharacterized protein n=1 Tax=Legionella steelei TaxID=947033 RepID=A0A0W0ZJ19_9GAMM|nr:hypothetical protein [Legionella steelei]KTD69063.1 hypothetical protein Lste_2221 [Legionella steelei]
MQYLAQSKESNEVNQYQFLRNNQFYWLSNLDMVIGKGIKSGFFNQEELIAESLKLNNEVKKRNLKDNLFTIWDLFHNSFDDNEEEVITALYKGFQDYIDIISTTDVHAIVTLLRSLKKEQLANDLVDKHISFLEKENIVFDNDSYSFDKISDPYFVGALKLLNEKIKPTPTLQKTINHIVNERGWNPIHENVLLEASSDEYYQLFYSLKGEELRKSIKRMLNLFNDNSPNSNHKIISSKIKEAIKMIGKTSNLNAQRVFYKFGISI